MLNPAVPEALDAIVLRALKHDPSQRYSSAAEMLAELEALSGAVASRDSLLKYLGAIGPDVYACTCEGCGDKIPYGVDCRQCKTQVETIASAWSAPPGDAQAGQRPAHPAAVRRAVAAMEWLRRLRLMVYVFWGRLQNWLEGRKRHLSDAIEQIDILWQCAWPRVEAGDPTAEEAVKQSLPASGDADRELH
jgi:hypothetical protein